MRLSCPNYLPCQPCPAKMESHIPLLLSDGDLRKTGFLFSFWIHLLGFGIFKCLSCYSKEDCLSSGIVEATSEKLAEDMLLFHIPIPGNQILKKSNCY